MCIRDSSDCFLARQKKKKKIRKAIGRDTFSRSSIPAAWRTDCNCLGIYISVSVVWKSKEKTENLSTTIIVQTFSKWVFHIVWLGHPNKMFCFTSPRLFWWWVGRSGKKKKKREWTLAGVWVPEKVELLNLRPVSRKSRKLFWPEKPFVKLQPANSVKLVCSYGV